jgi:hypothetical protein
MMETTNSETAFNPKVGEVCLYIERGGVNWFACRIIAEYDGLYWLHNFHTGAHPVKRKEQIFFKPIPLGVLQQGGAK